MGRFMLEAELGESIHSLVQRAVNHANLSKRDCQLKWGDVIVNVYVGSIETDIIEKWSAKRELKRLLDERWRSADDRK